jgi:hypothetical protein
MMRVHSLLSTDVSHAIWKTESTACSPNEDLEGRTNLSECIFEAPFKGVSTRFGRRKRGLKQSSATSPLFFDNLPHWGEHFDKHFKVDLWLTLLSKCSKWRLSKKRGLVADGWSNWPDCGVLRMPVPSLSRGRELDTSQTKILEGGTKDVIRLFETLFKGVRNLRLGGHTIAPFLVRHYD